MLFSKIQDNENPKIFDTIATQVSFSDAGFGLLLKYKTQPIAGLDEKLNHLKEQGKIINYFLSRYSSSCEIVFEVAQRDNAEGSKYENAMLLEVVKIIDSYFSAT